MTNPTFRPKTVTIPTRSAHQLGQAIARCRIRAAHTQMSVAKSAGLRQATVSKVEGGSGTTAINTIYALCAALNLELVLRPRQSADTEFRPEEIFSHDPN